MWKLLLFFSLQSVHAFLRSAHVLKAIAFPAVVSRDQRYQESSGRDDQVRGMDPSGPGLGSVSDGG